MNTERITERGLLLLTLLLIAACSNSPGAAPPPTSAPQNSQASIEAVGNAVDPNANGTPKRSFREILCDRDVGAACDALRQAPSGREQYDPLLTLARMKDPACIPFVETLLRADPGLVRVWQIGWTDLEDHYFSNIEEWRSAENEWRLFYERICAEFLPQPPPSYLLEGVMCWFENAELFLPNDTYCGVDLPESLNDRLVIMAVLDRNGIGSPFSLEACGDELEGQNTADVCYYALRLPCGAFLRPLRRTAVANRAYVEEMITSIGFGRLSGEVDCTEYDRGIALIQAISELRDAEAISAFLMRCLPGDPALDELLLRLSTDARVAEEVAALARPTVLPRRNELMRAVRDNLLEAAGDSPAVRRTMESSGLLTTSWELAVERFYVGQDRKYFSTVR